MARKHFEDYDDDDDDQTEVLVYFHLIRKFIKRCRVNRYADIFTINEVMC